MRVVLDANQSGLLAAASARSPGVVLSPLVLAEIVLNPHGQGILKRLATYDVKIGLTTSDVTARMSALTKTQIRSFTPFPEADATYRNSYGSMLSLVRGEIAPSDPDVQSWARGLKEQGRERFADSMRGAAERFRDRIFKGEVAKTKFASMSDVVDVMPPAARGSYLEDLIYSTVIDGGARRTRTRRRNLTRAVLANAHLATFFMVLFAYTLGCSRMLTPHRLHIDPTVGRDDWTDIVLPLYAAIGDVILTSDQVLRELVRFVDPHEQIRTLTVDEARAARIEI